MDISTMLHAVNPYNGFDADEYPLDLHGWGSTEEIFSTLIERTRPKLIIEVGTWKGASAVHMAKCAKALDLNTKILCVDTWLGAGEFWDDKDDPERYLSLKLRSGYPSVYYQFLANVVKSGFEDTIVPFPQTSQIAARWLRKHDVQADLIYIDGSHDESDVIGDISAYWDVVRQGGILFGDDYDEYWPSVRAAVKSVAEAGIGRLTTSDRHWILEKNEDFATGQARPDVLESTRVNARFGVIGEQLQQLAGRSHELLRAIRNCNRDVRAQTNQQIDVTIRELQALLRQKDETIEKLRASIEEMQTAITAGEEMSRVYAPMMKFRNVRPAFLNVAKETQRALEHVRLLPRSITRAA